LVSMLVDREKNEVVISEIVFGMIPGWPYEEFQKIFHISILIIHDWNQLWN
jgi:hypothetical protein